MRLDAVLMSPDLEWLTTKVEKVEYLTSKATSQPRDHLVNPSPQRDRDSANQFPGTFPIGVDPGGHVVLLYLVTAPWTDDFRTFLVGDTALLDVARSWTLQLVFPQQLRRATDAYQTAAREELASPLDAQTTHDLSRYFFHRRRGTDPSTLPDVLRHFLNECRRLFAGPRFVHLYRRWLSEEAAALTPVSPAIANALAIGQARVECVVLPHTYEHLSPLVSRRRSRPRRLHQGEREREHGSAQHQPVSQPGSSTRS
jgi:hypothetical protein